MTPQEKAKQRIEHYMKLFSLDLENTIHIDEAKAIVESECDEIYKNYVAKSSVFSGQVSEMAQFILSVKRSVKDYKPE